MSRSVPKKVDLACETCGEVRKVEVSKMKNGTAAKKCAPCSRKKNHPKL